MFSLSFLPGCLPYPKYGLSCCEPVTHLDKLYKLFKIQFSHLENGCKRDLSCNNAVGFNKMVV